MNDVKDSAEFYRSLRAGAEAQVTQRDEENSQLRAEVARLRGGAIVEDDITRAITHLMLTGEAVTFKGVTIEAVDSGRVCELEAEVARHVTNLAECYRIAGADPDGNTDAMLAQDAVRAVMDLRRDYDEACEDDDQLRAEVARLRAALVEARVQVDCIEHYSDDAESRKLACNAIEVIDAALEPTR